MKLYTVEIFERKENIFAINRIQCHDTQFDWLRNHFPLSLSKIDNSWLTEWRHSISDELSGAMLERLRIFESYCASSYRQEKEAHKTLEENIKILAEQ